jgi:hypothetical protein
MNAELGSEELLLLANKLEGVRSLPGLRRVDNAGLASTQWRRQETIT